jgi:hypothetical protein
VHCRPPGRDAAGGISIHSTEGEAPHCAGGEGGEVDGHARPRGDDKWSSQLLADLLRTCPPGEHNTAFFRSAFLKGIVSRDFAILFFI